MDAFSSHRRSSSSDRFLILFSPPPASPKPDYYSLLSGPASETDSTGTELQEDDIFSANNGSGSDPVAVPGHYRSPNGVGSGSSSSAAAAGNGRRLINLPDPPSGMLALLQDEKKPAASSTASSLHRKATIASATSASTTTTTTARMMIPAPKVKVKEEYALPHQSAPLNIPVRPVREPRSGIWAEEAGEIRDGGEYTDVSEMLPPHEIVARRAANTPLTASSCLEGVGRTLKGRDLRRVRNAVWRQTGFLD